MNTKNFILKFAHLNFLALALAFSPLVFAGWQQGEATVILNGTELSDVRIEVIKNAVADASFKNGSFISAEDVVLDGLLVSSKSVITTQGEIQRVEILSETLKNDVFEVVVNVNFSPLFECENDGYKRSVLTTQFQILKPQQASYGGIFDLGGQISKRFERQLRAEESHPKVLLIDKAFTNVHSYDKMNMKEISEKAVHLAREYGRQFILFGFIRDISLFEQVKEELLEDEISLRRNFTMQVYVLDTYSHNIIFQESYHSESDWEFTNDYNVDTNNSLFWRSNYGRMVLNTVNATVHDVSNALQCEKSYAQIINTAQGKFTINIGQEHGVKLGDKFSLYKKRLPIGANGMSHAMLSSDSSQLLKVIHVDQLTAVLDNNSPNQLSDADLLDLVSPH